MSTIKIYTIDPNYRKATIWQGSRMSNARISVHTTTPDKNLTREQRHAVIASWLHSNFNIPGPCYRAALAKDGGR